MACLSFYSKTIVCETCHCYSFGYAETILVLEQCPGKAVRIPCRTGAGGSGKDLRSRNHDYWY